MKVGAAIKAKRKEQLLRQEELARRVGITQSYLSQLENDRKEPNLSTLRRISEALNIPLPFLMALSLSAEDVPEHKREAFDALYPKMESLINKLLSEEDEPAPES
jgi:transcriptional regulator with XRE-family HTH domain